MIYSSDGSVYDSEMHHQLDEPQEERPVRVAGKKSYEPPPIKKPPTLPPLEPLTDPGNPPRGQYGPPGIEYPPWTVERPFAMNDNTPPLPLDITMPNIAGGLSKPPKPANDNDSRKPLRLSEYKGSVPNADEWEKYIGDVPVKGGPSAIDKILEGGPTIYKKGHADVEKYLKDNPDVEFRDITNMPGYRMMKLPPKDTTPVGEIPGDAIAHELDYEDLFKRAIGPGAPPDFAFIKAGKVPKVGDLEDVESSKNIVTRGADLPTSSKELSDKAKEVLYDKKVARQRIIDYGEDSVDTFSIGLNDATKQRAMAEARTEYKRMMDLPLDTIKSPPLPKKRPKKQ